MDFILQGLIEAIKLLAAGGGETYSAIFTTLKVSTISIIASLILGIPLGFLLGYAEFPGRRFCRTLADTLLALPTVVVGLLVYAFISRRGPFGDLGLLFTLPGIAIGQTILALPIVISLTASAIEGLDQRLRLTLLTLGASGRQLALTSLREGLFAVLIASVTAYGRIISEVGVSMMLGGNIKWYTRTITTAMALETNKGEFAMGLALGIVLLIIAFTVNAILSILKMRAGI
ncbi:MAG: ABC transporter permease [Deltaproteobacteria bacterium]|nr:ABC transporter permease [Deltaproteobacteria bacterium]MBW2051180.1 ABC transporter permease [Deltaproteobacteria bacterium]MBW2140486.1 ABC transporter permease [Deltaproteobacteria bacterium]MBW2322206.1 ABC transporter permease [Deltaproteobacteria bacterium]